MAKAYYALVAGLPDLILDESRLAFSRLNFLEDLRTQLTSGHFRQIETLFYNNDNENLLNLLQEGGAPHNSLGVFSEEELEEEIRVPGTLPSYMGRFVEEFRTGFRLPEGMTLVNRLTGLMYNQLFDPEGGLPGGFVREWLAFDRDLRNVLTALVCRSMDRSPDVELVGSGFVVESILRGNSGDFGLGRELTWIERVLQLYSAKDLLDREKGLDELRWEFIDEITTFDYFTINKVAAFMVKLGIAERWLALEEETGRELFGQIMRDLESGFEFPAEFSVRGGSKHANNG